MDFRGNFNSGPGFNQGGGSMNMNDALGLAANLLAAAIGQGNQGNMNQFGGGGGGGPMMSPSGHSGLLGPSPLMSRSSDGPGFNWRQQVSQGGGGQQAWGSSPHGNSPYMRRSYDSGNNFRGNFNKNQRNDTPRQNKAANTSNNKFAANKKTAEAPKSSEKSVTVKKEQVEKPAEAAKKEETPVKKEAEVNDEKKDTSKYAGIPSNLLHCSACNKTMWNGESFERHLNGAPHQHMCELMADKHEMMVALLRQHIKLLEGRREIVLAKMRKQSKKVPDNKSYCPMCDIHVFGSILGHRKTLHHQKLKDFLHPHCKPCDKEFTLRTDWDEHKLTEQHLRKMDKAGGVEHEDDYFDLLDIGKKKDLKKEEEEKVEEEDEEGKLLADDKIADYHIPAFDETKGIGTSFIKPVNGCFCKICKKFLHSEAVEAHIKTQQHYNKFVEAVTAKKAKGVKRETEEPEDANGAKKVKLA